MRLIRVTATRTATPPLAESTAFAISTTRPPAVGLSGLSPAAVSDTDCPTRARAASAGLNVSTMSSACGSATSTSGWLGSAPAPRTAVMRVTVPPIGARSVLSSRERRAFTAFSFATPRSAAAISASLRGSTPASASRSARAAAFSLAPRVASALCSAASNGAVSNSMSGSPALTVAPTVTNTFDTRVCAGAASSATCPGRADTAPSASTVSLNVVSSAAPSVAVTSAGSFFSSSLGFPAQAEASTSSRIACALMAPSGWEW